MLSTLDKLEKDGTIRMVRKAFNFSGTPNILNPSSLIHYEFVR